MVPKKGDKVKVLFNDVAALTGQAEIKDFVLNYYAVGNHKLTVWHYKNKRSGFRGDNFSQDVPSEFVERIFDAPKKIKK